MGLLRAAACLLLALAPHAVLYQASELAEYEAGRSVAHGATAGAATVALKACLTAMFAPAGDSGAGAPLRAGVAALVGLADAAGLWYALTRLQHRGVSSAHKAQAVGLGWAAAAAALARAVPIAQHALAGADLSAAPVLAAFAANVALLHAVSFAAAGVLFWRRRAPGAVGALRAVVLAHALAPAALGALEADAGRLAPAAALAAQAGCTLTLALATRSLWQAAATSAKSS